MSNAIEYRGKCNCGSVEVIGTAKPLSAFYCHCSICRKASAAPFISVAVLPIGTVRFVGETVTYASSVTHRRHYCKNCYGAVGCTIEAYGVEMLAITLLPRVPEELKPKYHMFYGDRIIDIKDGLPKYKEGSRSQLLQE